MGVGGSALGLRDFRLLWVSGLGFLGFLGVSCFLGSGFRVSSFRALGPKVRSPSVLRGDRRSREVRDPKRTPGSWSLGLGLLVLKLVDTYGYIWIHMDGYIYIYIYKII